MAATTEDSIIGGMKVPVFSTKANFTGEAAGQWTNLLSKVGIPAAGTLGTPGMAGATVDNTSSIAGYLPFTDPTGGKTAYLARFSAGLGASMVGIMLYDLLWYQSGIGITTTTGQTINSVTWPARDADGATAGRGVQIWLHCKAAVGNAAAIARAGLTITYTNSAGAGSKTGTAYINWPATPVIDTMMPFDLAASDVGVQSVQTYTCTTTMTSGTVNLLALRPVATIFLPTAAAGFTYGWAELGLPVLYAGSALYAAVMLSSTAAGVTNYDIAVNNS